MLSPSGLQDGRDRDIQSVLPKGFQGVALTDVIAEDMEEHVEGVDDRPAAVALGFGAASHADLVERLLEGDAQGAQVRLGSAGGDHEEIGDGGNLAHLQDADLDGLLVIERADGGD